MSGRSSSKFKYSQNFVSGGTYRSLSKKEWEREKRFIPKEKIENEKRSSLVPKIKDNIYLVKGENRRGEPGYFKPEKFSQIGKHAKIIGRSAEESLEMYGEEIEKRNVEYNREYREGREKLSIPLRPNPLVAIIRKKEYIIDNWRYHKTETGITFTIESGGNHFDSETVGEILFVGIEVSKVVGCCVQAMMPCLVKWQVKQLRYMTIKEFFYRLQRRLEKNGIRVDCSGFCVINDRTLDNEEAKEKEKSRVRMKGKIDDTMDIAKMAILGLSSRSQQIVGPNLFNKGLGSQGYTLTEYRMIVRELLVEYQVEVYTLAMYVKVVLSVIECKNDKIDDTCRIKPCVLCEIGKEIDEISDTLSAVYYDNGEKLLKITEPTAFKTEMETGDVMRDRVRLTFERITKTTSVIYTGLGFGILVEPGIYGFLLDDYKSLEKKARILNPKQYVVQTKPLIEVVKSMEVGKSTSPKVMFKNLKITADKYVKERNMSEIVDETKLMMAKADLIIGSSVVGDFVSANFRLNEKGYFVTNRTMDFWTLKGKVGVRKDVEMTMGEMLLFISDIFPKNEELLNEEWENVEHEYNDSDFKTMSGIHSSYHEELRKSILDNIEERRNKDKEAIKKIFGVGMRARNNRNE